MPLRHGRVSEYTRRSSTGRSGAIVLVGCFGFYAVGGARLGPGARAAPPRASTFSRTSSASAKSGGTTHAALSRDGGAEARGSARTARWCDTCRRCAAARGFALNAIGSACRTTTHRPTSLARAPLVMHRADSPKRTATSESRKEAELRRAMRVPADACTSKTLAALGTLAAKHVWILCVNLAPYSSAVRPSRDLA
jgi:hypothetical protein